MMLGLGLSRSPSQSPRAWLAAFMASQSDGFWYDFASPDRLFQETVGPTPSDDPNEVIGLALSQRLWNGQTLAQVVAAATELSPIEVGTTAGTVTDNGDGTYTLAANSAVRFRFTLADLTNGAAYEVKFTLTQPGATGVAADLCDGTSASFSGSGVKVFYGSRATYDSTFRFVDIASGSGGATVTAAKLKLVSRYPATQATTSLKPKFQTTGAAFDGSDDNLLTGYTAGAGANFLIAKVTVPPTLAATQVIAGATAASTTERFMLGVSAVGNPVCGAGGFYESLGQDVRGVETVLGVSFDASLVRIFSQGRPAFETARAGVFTTSVPVRLGARNVAGTATNFFGGSIARIVAGRQFLDLATFNQIAAAI